jgi:hypothetical protein
MTPELRYVDVDSVGPRSSIRGHEEEERQQDAQEAPHAEVAEEHGQAPDPVQHRQVCGLALAGAGTPCGDGHRPGKYSRYATGRLASWLASDSDTAISAVLVRHPNRMLSLLGKARELG